MSNNINIDHGSDIQPLKDGGKLKPTGLVSVIVPAYNAEKYMKHCLSSLTSQTYKDLEIVICDDGSTDKTAEILDKAANKDKRIRVIHKENGGVSSARNAALKECTGEYILFVDSDDWIEKDTCMKVLRAMQANDADVCFYNLFIVNENGKKALRRPEAPEGVCGREVLVGETISNYYPCVNNKCFKRSAVTIDGGIHEFDTNARILEDGLWLMGVSHLWNRGVLLKEGLGYRRIWSGSAMNSAGKRSETDLEYLRNFQKIMPRFAEYSEELGNSAKEHFMAYALQAMKRYTGRDNRKTLEAITSEMEKVDKNYNIYIYSNLFDALFSANKKIAELEKHSPKAAAKKTAKKIIPHGIRKKLKK